MHLVASDGIFLCRCGNRATTRFALAVPSTPASQDEPICNECAKKFTALAEAVRADNRRIIEGLVCVHRMKGPCCACVDAAMSRELGTG